jgi:hypothetical protein
MHAQGFGLIGSDASELVGSGRNADRRLSEKRRDEGKDRERT